jgi:hypothetical protein
MKGSPADAISPAIERTKQLLFPFDANKWFTLGFTVFLAQCGESGGSFPNIPSGSGTSPGGSGGTNPVEEGLAEISRALSEHLTLILVVGALAIVLLIAIGVFVLWFSSRARLMFVESVIWDRVKLEEQWPRARELGFSLFKVRLLLGSIASVLMLGGIAVGVAIGWQDYASSNFFGSRAVTSYVVYVAVWLLLLIPYALLTAIIDDFVVPLMVLRNVPMGPAWTMCRSEVLAGNAGGIAVFYLLRIAIAFAMAMLASIAMCLTCCLVALPYLGTVALLPLHVFSRAYPLHYLESLGIRVYPPPEPAWAAQERWRFPA